MEMLKIANHNLPKIAKIAIIPNNKFLITIQCFAMMEAIPTFMLAN